MTNIIEIDIVSDVACPWCIIGYKRLAQAISQLNLKEKVKIEWQPFELNPDMSVEGEEIIAHLTRKYGTTPDESRKTLSNITDLGEELGIGFDFFNGFKMVNTRDLHILLEYAKERNKQTELKLRLFEAFFSECKDVSDREILITEVESVGLDISEAQLRLNDDKAQKRIATQEAYWHRIGISAVPTIVFNRTGALTGAQPVSVYKEALEELTE